MSISSPMTSESSNQSDTHSDTHSETYSGENLGFLVVNTNDEDDQYWHILTDDETPSSASSDADHQENLLSDSDDDASPANSNLSASHADLTLSFSLDPKDTTPSPSGASTPSSQDSNRSVFRFRTPGKRTRAAIRNLYKMPWIQFALILVLLMANFGVIKDHAETADPEACEQVSPVKLYETVIVEKVATKTVTSPAQTVTVELGFQDTFKHHYSKERHRLSSFINKQLKTCSKNKRLMVVLRSTNIVLDKSKASLSDLFTPYWDRASLRKARLFANLSSQKAQMVFNQYSLFLQKQGVKYHLELAPFVSNYAGKLGHFSKVYGSVTLQGLQRVSKRVNSYPFLEKYKSVGGYISLKTHDTFNKLLTSYQGLKPSITRNDLIAAGENSWNKLKLTSSSYLGKLSQARDKLFSRQFLFSIRSKKIPSWKDSVKNMLGLPKRSVKGFWSQHEHKKPESITTTVKKMFGLD